MTKIACLLLLLFLNDFVTFKKDNKSTFFSFKLKKPVVNLTLKGQFTQK